jgi:hypothetical protein
MSRVFLDESGVSLYFWTVIALVGLVCAVLGLGVGYAVGSAVLTEEFVQELRWHYSPVKVNHTSYWGNQFDACDQSFRAIPDADFSGGWNGTAWRDR